MIKNVQSSGKLSVCYKDSCIHSTGKNAKHIAYGLTAMFILIGIAAISRKS